MLYLHHNKQHQHPLKDSLVLVACFVSGNISKNKVFLKGQPKYLSSWKTGTKKQYSSCIERWIRYCRKREVNQLQPDITNILEYFSYLFDLGLGYSTLNTTRGALSAFGIKIDGVLVGKIR